MKLHIANINDYQDVRSFYDQLIDEMENADFKPGWKKGVYPTDQFLKDSIKDKHLYIVTLNNLYVGAMVMNHESNDGYDKINWKVKVSNDDIFIIHALGILPRYHGQGIAKYLIQEAIKLSINIGKIAIRLDVLATNVPAQKLYTKIGFQYIDTVKLFYEDTGLTDYLVYEFIL